MRAGARSQCRRRCQGASLRLASSDPARTQRRGSAMAPPQACTNKGGSCRRKRLRGDVTRPMGQSRRRQKRRHGARKGPTRAIRDGNQLPRGKQAGMCFPERGLASEASKQAGGGACSIVQVPIGLFAMKPSPPPRAFETSVPFEVASCGHSRQTTCLQGLSHLAGLASIFFPP